MKKLKLKLLIFTLISHSIVFAFETTTGPNGLYEDGTVSSSTGVNLDFTKNYTYKNHLGFSFREEIELDIDLSQSFNPSNTYTPVYNQSSSYPSISRSNISNSLFGDPPSLFGNKNETPRDKYLDQMEIADGRPYFEINHYPGEFAASYSNYGVSLTGDATHVCQDLYKDLMSVVNAEEDTPTCSGKSLAKTIAQTQDLARQISYYKALKSKLSEKVKNNDNNQLTDSDIKTTISELVQKREESSYIDPKVTERDKLGKEADYLQAIGCDDHIVKSSDCVLTLNSLFSDDGESKALDAKIAILYKKMKYSYESVEKYKNSELFNDYKVIRENLLRKADAKGCIKGAWSADNTAGRMRKQELQSSICQKSTPRDLYGSEMPELVNDVYNILRVVDKQEINESETVIAENSTSDEQRVIEFYKACRGIALATTNYIYECESRVLREPLLMSGLVLKRDPLTEESVHEPIKCDNGEEILLNDDINGDPNQSMYTSMRDQEVKVDQYFRDELDKIVSESNLSIEQHQAIAMDTLHYEKISNKDGEKDDDKDDTTIEIDESLVSDNNTTGDDGNGATVDGGDQNNGGNSTSSNGNNNGNQQQYTPEQKKLMVENYVSTSNNLRLLSAGETCSQNEDKETRDGVSFCIMKCSSGARRKGYEGRYECYVTRKMVDANQNRVESAQEKKYKREVIGKVALSGAVLGGSIWAMSQSFDNNYSRGQSQMTSMMGGAGVPMTSSFGSIYGARSTGYSSMGYSGYSSSMGYGSYSSSLAGPISIFNNSGSLFDPTLSSQSYGTRYFPYTPNPRFQAP